MAKIYKAADHETHELLRRIVEERHPTLHEAHVSFGIRFVYVPLDDQGQPIGTPLTRGGRPANGALTVVSLKDRVFMPDVVIDLDGHRWDEASEDEQIAELDELCESIRATIGDDEARTVKSDTCDRPVLHRVEPDFKLSGYTAVMKRNGRFAPEARLVEEFTTTMQQAELPGFDDAAKPTTTTKRAPAVRAEAVAVEEADAVEALTAKTKRRAPKTRTLLEAAPGGVQ